jgi:predicted TIM-barrel fold metal-dependent hydrolase
MEGAIDFHAHWLPPQLCAMLRTRSEAPRIAPGPEGELFYTWQGKRPLAGLADLEERRAFMDRHGVATQVLSLAGLFGIDCLSPDEALTLVRAFNDATAAACRAAPARFAGLAALPLQDIALACRELERAHGLGLIGAILPADGLRTLYLARRYAPLFDAGQRHRSHFFVHPGPVAPQPERHVRDITDDEAWQRRIVLQTQAVLSEVVVTLNLSDFLDPYPDVTLQIANLGGAVPFLLERMDEVWRTQRRGASPSRRMGRCYVDTASFGPRAIRLALESFGADKVLLGTDCPIFSTPAVLEALQYLDAGERERVSQRNARSLLKK